MGITPYVGDFIFTSGFWSAITDGNQGNTWVSLPFSSTNKRVLRHIDNHLPPADRPEWASAGSEGAGKRDARQQAATKAEWWICATNDLGEMPVVYQSYSCLL